MGDGAMASALWQDSTSIRIRMEIEKLFCMVKMASQQDAAADTDPHGVT